MKKNTLIIPFLIILMGCANLVCNFDQNSFVAASQLKVDAIQLLAKASDPASDHAQEIADLQSKLDAQLAYEKGKGKSNQISSDEWNTLVSPSTNLLGRFLKDWSSGQQFSQAYIKEKTDQVGQAFDEILRMEGSKTK